MCVITCLNCKSMRFEENNNVVRCACLINVGVANSCIECKLKRDIEFSINNKRYRVVHYAINH